MGATLKNMLTFSPQNVTAYAWLPLVLIWLVIVAVMMIDIIRTSGSRLRMCIWIFVTLSLPGFSAVIYAMAGIASAVKKSVITPAQ